MMKRIIRHMLIALLVLISGHVVGAQTTAFTYQGNLSVGGAPANGNYDFQFLLFGAATGGSSIGLGLGINSVPVTNGSFSVVLNFGSQFTVSNRFLEIRVRPAGQGSHTTLTPRQPILSTPYSINAAQLGGTAADQFVVTTDSRLIDSRDPLPNSGNYIQNRTTPQALSNFNISGNGAIGGSLTVVETSAFQKTLSVGTNLNVGETGAVGGNLTVGGTLSVNSLANVTGTINTGSHFKVGGDFALGRSRLDLFNTDATPRGFTFEVLNNPEFLVIKNELGATLMTVAGDGKVGIGDNSPTQATLEVGGAVQISGSLTLGQLGGGTGDHLCRGAMGLVQVCAAAANDAGHTHDGEDKVLGELRSVIRQQQAEIERQRNELAALKSFICAQNSSAEVCRK